MSPEATVHDHPTLTKLSNHDGSGQALVASQPSVSAPRPAVDVRLITVAEAAERLGLSRSKLYLLIADGELPTVRIGRARRIDLADLRAYVDRHRAA